MKKSDTMGNTCSQIKRPVLSEEANYLSNLESFEMFRHFLCYPSMPRSWSCIESLPRVQVRTIPNVTLLHCTHLFDVIGCLQAVKCRGSIFYIADSMVFHTSAAHLPYVYCVDATVPPCYKHHGYLATVTEIRPTWPCYDTRWHHFSIYLIASIGLPDRWSNSP